MKISKGAGKVILKRAFEQLVPREVLYRPKQGFSVPLADWFRGPLGQSFQRDLTGDSGLADCGLFDTAAIRRLIEQHRNGSRDHSRLLWLFWMFHRFLTDVHTDSPAEFAPVFGK
jgi:asparagine synthase (glutamine-hydrolysing)